jgi:hypothetical protein
MTSTTSHLHPIPELDRAGLRKFGLTTGAIVAVLFGLLLPWLFNAEHWPLWPWILAAALWLPALIHPEILRPVYTGWMKIGALLGFVNTRIILGLFFYVIMMPAGLAMRLLRKDPMRRKPDPGPTYRVQSRANPPKHMENPF